MQSYCLRNKVSYNLFNASPSDMDAAYILDCIGELYAFEDHYKWTRLDADTVRKAHNLTQTLEITRHFRSKMDVPLPDGHLPREN